MTRLPSVAYQSPAPQLGKPKKRPSLYDSISRTRGQPYNPNPQQSPAYQTTSTTRAQPFVDYGAGDATPAAQPWYHPFQPVGSKPQPFRPVGVNWSAPRVGRPPGYVPGTQGFPLRNPITTSLTNVANTLGRERIEAEAEANPQLQAIRQARASLGGGSTTMQRPPSLFGQLTNEIGAPRGGGDQPYWGEASRRLQSQLVGGGQDILAQRAAGNEGLRQQMVGGTGNRFPSTAMRGKYWRQPEVQPEVQTGEMIARTPLQVSQDSQLVEAMGYRDQERQNARTRVAAGGGFPQAPRAGLGGLIDRVLPRKSYDMSQDRRPFFAEQVARMDAQKQKRARYLAGEGEYEGRGPTERAASIAARRAPMTAEGMQDRAERRWRMSGGPQQQMLNNYMTARNPALALGMYRTNVAAQQAALDRDIEQQRLQIQRDEMAGRRTDAAQERLQQMEMFRGTLGMQGQQLQQQGQIAQQGFGLQRELGANELAQKGMQHTESIAAINAGNKRAEEERAADLRDKRAAMRIQLKSDPKTARWSDADIEAELDQSFPDSIPAGVSNVGVGSGQGQTPQGDASGPEIRYKPGGPIPRDLKDYADSSNPQAFAKAAKDKGYWPWDIDMMWKTITGNPTATMKLPKGPTLWYAMKTGLSTMGSAGPRGTDKYRRERAREAQAWRQWRENPGNKY